jgi:hypothetical protein
MTHSLLEMVSKIIRSENALSLFRGAPSAALLSAATTDVPLFTL